MIAEAEKTKVPYEHFVRDRPPREIFGMLNGDGSPVLWYYDDERWESITRKQVLKHRVRVKLATDGTDMASMDARALQAKLCARDSADGLIYWLTTFGWIFEPRNDGAHKKQPFIPYGRQLDLIDWKYWVRDQPLGQYSSGLVEKSRAVGATWLFAADSAKHWQFDPNPWVGGAISRTDELVDNRGDPASYFWKVQYLLQQQPDWLLPAGFAGFHERSPHRSHAKLINPDTDSVLVGSTTTDLSFVGARLSELHIDEAATLEGFNEVWNNTASVTDHRYAITTPRTRHTLGVYNLREGLEGYVRPAIFSFRWHEIPGRDEYWYAGMRETMKADLFEREINLNWRSDQGEFVYERAWDIQASDEFGYQPGWPVIVGIDDGWDDECFITWMQRDVLNDRYRVIGGYSNRGKPVGFYGHILTGDPLAEDGLPPTEYQFSDHDLRMMEWVKACGLRKARFYGDRHGDNTEFGSGKSPFQVLTDKTGIIVITNSDKKHNDVQYRIDAVSAVLSKMDFHTGHGAPLVLEALKNSRYPKSRDTAQPTREARAPIHDQYSHPRSTVEYIFINERMMSRPPLRRKAAPERLRGAGRGTPMGRRQAGVYLGVR